MAKMTNDENTKISRSKEEHCYLLRHFVVSYNRLIEPV